MMTAILTELGFPVDEVIPFRSAEDDSAYDVWKVTANGETFVLKKAKGREAEIYSAFFSEPVAGVPRLIKQFQKDGDSYLLMEYIPGRNLCRCEREGLTKALDALIRIQERFWERLDLDGLGIPFAEALARRQNRGNYLADPELEKAYGQYLTMFALEARTLCHDDLLPFNLIVGEDRAVIIDWEVAGILPYPTSLARLIAHGSEKADAFFYMTGDDKNFAIRYYYEHLIQGKGIGWEDYRRAVDLCLLYEYCEWIMLGNRYPDVDRERFQTYLDRAKTLVQTL